MLDHCASAIEKWLRALVTWRMSGNKPITPNGAILTVIKRVASVQLALGGVFAQWRAIVTVAAVVEVHPMHVVGTKAKSFHITRMAVDVDVALGERTIRGQ